MNDTGLEAQPAVLHGAHVRLEPLRREHAPAFIAAASHAELWRYMPFALMSAAAFDDFMDKAARHAGQPFAIVRQDTGAVIGGSGFWNIDRQHRRLEIGASWITPAQQRTAANTEAKYLLLRHAFEALGCMRVEFKTDALNDKSRTALRRIGAREEGVFRRHMVMRDGRKRDSVYFSIIEDEWPAVKARLEGFLGRG